MMTLRYIFPAAAIVASVLAPVRADQVSEKIDELVEANYKAKKIEPNAPVSDEVFVRRAYLDIIGRIPSMEEARAFLESGEAGKRTKLIDTLLGSEGYVSHWYNWWADILRVQTGMRDEAGTAYAEWVKDSLRKNVPYDQFVKTLVTAEGFVWDNGAVGYYLRDAGMPLDNMSNTAQIFLGTRLVCAQCHNHPFDRWTQKDYYQMAAYTYNVSTELNPMDFVRGLDEKALASKTKRSGERQRQALRRIIDGMLEPLKNGVGENEGTKLNLPGDYKYDDAKPGEMVEARTIFGEKVASRREARKHYAEWMASTENPRFTLVMANRLWKRVMGMGLIEPVDDFKDGTEASNPVLMKYLTSQLVNMRYDTKKFLRAIYNTKTYQRETTRGDVPEDQPYYFPGPVLRRMTAEQIWDSVCTIVIPDPDGRKRGEGYKAKLEVMRREADQLKAATKDDIIAVAKKYADMDAEAELKAMVAREKLNKAREAGDAKVTGEAQKELNALNSQRDGFETAARAELIKLAGEKSRSIFTTAVKKPGMGGEGGKDMVAVTPNDPGQWAGFGDEFFRASELPSPAPGGHFLREFGQSNREVIENASGEATVSQALNLMNGPVFNVVMGEKSQLMQRFSGASNDEGRMNAIFMTLYGRKPNETEKAIVAEAVAEKGKDGWKNVIWALLNSREFVFIQ
jgi:hypothetical protein